MQIYTIELIDLLSKDKLQRYNNIYWMSTTYQN